MEKRIEWLSNNELITIANLADIKCEYSKDDLLKELAKRLIRETKPKDGESKGQFMQHKMSDFLNNTLCDEKGFVSEVKKDHRTLQQSMFNLCLKVIKSFSEYGQYDYDGRNEASVRKAKIIVKALDDADESINCPFI